MSNDGFCPADAAGKPVFFVPCVGPIETEMVSELIQEEYEVYRIEDPAKAVALFHHHPNTVAFLNIDAAQPESDWEQYVRDLQEDPELQCLQIGIVTSRNDPVLSQKYLMNLMVSAGVVKLNQGVKEVVSQVRKVLEVNDARGRRQFLRVRCNDATSSLRLKIGEKDLVGTVTDLSTAGMACTFDPEPDLPSHTRVEDIQLRLKGVPCFVSGEVVGTRRDDDHLTYVVLFNGRTSPDSREKIRSFLAWTLQTQLEAETATTA